MVDFCFDGPGRDAKLVRLTKQQSEAHEAMVTLLADLPELTAKASDAWEARDMPTFAETWRKVRNRVYAAQTVFDHGHFRLTGASRRGKQP